jgi:hypothetical protein
MTMKLPDDHYQPLCQTEHGHILHCPDCGGMLLCFGNAVIGLAKEDVLEFRRAIAVEKDTILYMGESTVGFAFSAAEVAELNTLLDEAECSLVFDGCRWGAVRRPTAFATKGGRPYARH